MAAKSLHRRVLWSRFVAHVRGWCIDAPHFVEGRTQTLRLVVCAAAAASGWDGFITKLGNATFFDNLASFPVLYVDEDLTVFRCSICFSAASYILCL